MLLTRIKKGSTKCLRDGILHSTLCFHRPKMTATAIPTQSRVWVLKNKPTALPQLLGDTPTFSLETRDLPTLKDNEILVEALYYSNDPAQRGWIAANLPEGRLYTQPLEVGEVMRARGLAKVIDSKCERFSVGAVVQGNLGWREYAVLKAGSVAPTEQLPGGLNQTHYLGALGGTGLTAYYGLAVVGHVKENDRVVVSGAAGAVGSMAVQIAKHVLGASNVIGIAGSDAKCRWVESLGADRCLNYKSSNFAKDLKEAAGNGVDVFLDNVGGDILDLMLGQMSQDGRVAICGAISSYNSEQPTVLKNYTQIISMRLQLKGFIVIDFASSFAQTQTLLKEAIRQGKIRVGDENETVVPTEFTRVPETWLRLFSGESTGKLVTKLVTKLE